MEPPIEIHPEDPRRPEVEVLLRAHLAFTSSVSPAGSMHALDVESLRTPDISFRGAWIGDVLVGCGALRELDAMHGEIKSMCTSSSHRRRGIGRAVLSHLVEEARRRGYARVSLETGSMEAFEAARRLYATHGFRVCGPFGAYVEDPNSVFMSLDL